MKIDSIIFYIFSIAPIFIFYWYPISDYPNSLRGYGNYLAGLAGVYIASKAVPEWIKSRKSRQIEKVDETLVAAKRFINAIFHISSPFSTVSTNTWDDRAKTGHDKAEAASLNRKEKMKPVFDDAEKLFKISSECNLYLNDDQIALVDRLKEIWNEISSNFQVYIFNLKNDIMTEETIKAWDIAHARKDLSKELLSLQEKVNGMMKKQRDSAK